MADRFRVEIQGAAKLRRALKRAGVDMKELSAVNRRAAASVAAAAKPRTPVGPGKNGHLSATVRPGATQRAGIVRVGGKAKPYAGVVHYGWPARNIKANPWLIETAHDTENEWVELYMSELNRIIGRIDS